MKVTFNKINMDMVGILVYEEIIPISNAILSILSNEDETPNKNINNIIENENSKNISYYSINVTNVKKNFEESEYTMNFVIHNFQICIENEITKSRLLISTQEDIIFKINKVCFNEKEKNFLMELIIKDFIFFIPPSIHLNSPNIINWIRISENNNLYLPQEQFNQIAKIPNVFFEVKEIIKNNKEFENINQIEEIMYNDKNDVVTNSTIFIKIDKLKGEFRKEDFNCFMNIIKVFLFNRGDSYAKEKLAMDSKRMDLKKYKLNDIKLKIKESENNKSNKIQKKVKEIKFKLEEISMTLLNDKEKDFLILLMKKLTGEQMVYDDLGSELITNIENLKILDLQNPRNEIILSQQNNISTKNQKIIINNNNEAKPFYVNKIEMLRFRLKDNYISIGTDSKWYTIQYLELGILPLYLNITKNQCDFILKFFFNTDSTKNMSGEEYKKIIEEQLSDDENKKEQKIVNKNDNDNDINKPEEPFYFNNVKINDMKLNISFYYGDGSPFNFKKAEIKLKEFEKRDKFYSLSILISRFISHLKYMAIANLANIISSFFFTREERNETNESTDEKKLKEENKNKELLFGKLYNK